MLKKLRGIGDPFRPTEREYQASINALNIFFGAVIGINLGGAESLSVGDYVVLLVATSAIVMAILFVSYTHRRIWNSIVLVASLAAYWYILERDGFAVDVSDKLAPTLAIWGTMAILTEFMPRSKDPAEDQESA